MEALKCKSVESILTERDIKSIVHRAASHEWTILGYDIKVAGQGLSGFLGDHFRLTVHLESGDFTKKLHLFAKFLPLLNKPKAEFIGEYNFFKRENLLYKLFEEIGVANELKPWCPKAWIHTDSLIVMPDLSIEGYKSISHHECLDLQHVAVVVSSLARFHASFACFEAKRDIIHHQRNSFYKDHISVLKESPHFDAPWTASWLRAAAKLSFNLIQAFSNKIQKNIDDLEEKLTHLFFKACEDLEPSKDSLNVIIHRDLWINNILFRYEQGHPSEAVLLDFQCVRYAPPALDLMIFLYLTTSKEFRRAHEKEIFNQYYTVFTQHLDDTVKSKLKDYNYGRWDFFNWCERARMFAMVQAMAIFPFTLMSPSLAQKTFDNPDTFTKLMDEDRSEPVLAFARECTVYRERQLQVSEEFVERYILKPL
ncbi:unnamed protein product [Pieris macdunnoughi]|uniref:CHK kinase-like domain-containing protein n=1 Tax=Pieris macdunnoughi TaxID=345717 RepID=A0A821WR91_9NEOP|nr:unnamed protein product [Pieris macdunnoughi]